MLQVEDIHEARKNCGYDPGEVITMSRSDLEWQITVPKDGGLAEGGILPVLIQLPGGRNPADRLTLSPVQLTHLEITHPKSLQHREYSSEIGYYARSQNNPGQPCAVLSLEHAKRLSCSEV